MKTTGAVESSHEPTAGEDIDRSKAVLLSPPPAAPY